MRLVARLSAAIAVIIGLSWGSGADAGTLPDPQNPPILTLTGAIANTNTESGATFDDAMLATLPRRSITTSTPWYDGPRTFEGPLLRTVLAVVGATGRNLKVEALNDYSANVPFADTLTYDVILADRIDGAPIPVRERGPLFIVYPFDDIPSLRNEQYYERAVWQVKSIEVQ